MPFIKIISCKDSRWWYNSLIGEIVEYSDTSQSKDCEYVVLRDDLTEKQLRIVIESWNSFSCGYISKLDVIEIFLLEDILDILRKEVEHQTIISNVLNNTKSF